MASKHYHIKLNFESDREVIDRIESKENKNDYIRSLILSDIAADILRDSIKLDEQDPEKNEYFLDRVNFYNDNCPALNNPDSSKNHCDDCQYNVHYTDVDGKVKTACSLEDAWRKHWSLVIYHALGGADRNYHGEFNGLKKGDPDNG